MENSEIIYKLEGDGKASLISLDHLRESQLVRMQNGREIISRPIQSWELIDRITNQLGERGIPHALDNIYVQKSESQQILTSAERGIYTAENTPISKWLFNQLITKINVNPAREGDTNTSIALSFNKNGVLVAFGQNVRICSNMCVFGKNLMTTYGQNKVPFDKMLEVLNHWLDTMAEKEQFDLRMIEGMKSVEIDKVSEVDRLVGNLYRKSVEQAYGSVVAPFTMTQMSVLTQDINKRLKEDSRLGTVWDLYNIGTNLYKPTDVDMVNIYHAPKVWYDAILEEYPVLMEMANQTYFTPVEDLTNQAFVATGNEVAPDQEFM
jgi:hypothetical protein